MLTEPAASVFAAFAAAVVLLRAVLLPADAVCVHVAVHERQALLRRRHNSTAVPPFPVLHGKNQCHNAIQHPGCGNIPPDLLWNGWYAPRGGTNGSELLDFHPHGSDRYAGRAVDRAGSSLYFELLASPVSLGLPFFTIMCGID